MSHAARLRRWGASPLTRGKLRAQDGSADHLGLIPAHAGKTTRNRYPQFHTKAHPRSRGENPTFAAIVSKAAGSSPLTRGKPSIASQRRRTPRLIPAHAGKTCSQRCGCGRRRAHPRSRGENELPQTRNVLMPAHPRSRGENLPQRRHARLDAGSSPLTRGKPFRALLIRPRFRLIPAHTGKTGRACFRSRLRPAHPRSRGENVTHPSVRVRFTGLIPAHAGKT